MELQKLGISLVYREECVQCKHLVPFAKEQYDECHFEMGNNALCPARCMQVLVGFDIEKAVNGFVEAFKNNDLKRIHRNSEKLSDYDPRLQKIVMDEIKAKMGIPEAQQSSQPITYSPAPVIPIIPVEEVIQPPVQTIDLSEPGEVVIEDETPGEDEFEPLFVDEGSKTEEASSDDLLDKLWEDAVG